MTSTRSSLSGREQPPYRSISPDGSVPPPESSVNGQDVEEPTPKKRKKASKNDSDYRPPAQRKSTRKRASKGKADAQPIEDETSKQPPSEEYSSDLEDCREIWLADLSDYVLETQKRFRQVEQWFYASAKERASITAQNLSHHYSQRIARIPLPPPSPPPLPPQHADEYMYPPDSSEYPHGDVDSNYGPLEEHDDPRARANRGKDKRPLPGMMTDVGDDYDVRRGGPATKKRKLQGDAFEHGDDYGHAMDIESISVGAKAKGKQKQLAPREQSIDTVSSTPKAPRKKAALKKKVGGDIESNPPSVAGDMTPLPSRPTSPAPVNNTVIFELDEPIPPLKKAKKMDDAALFKRVKTLEEAQRKVWTNIARRDVAKVYKYHALGYQARQAQSERIAKLASIQARRPFTKTPKTVKETQSKAKKMVREMQAFWKKNEREERDVRKREQKEAMDRMKVEEERREAARQARKLEFLISQTELYSHFVGNKLKSKYPSFF
ncbi:hypothetical protein D9758_000154 [Tetrapyrgos nigripes]|uniref:Chromatin-remodeling ATPase INO80 n=1 Tax=Tetrapyrgos nigripes TaxID=182062 RepID=A0A8H5H1S5_9AGAR|nr:hypothetical protein D9758_000154 [Tetrapyrgos nigripes]